MKVSAVKEYVHGVFQIQIMFHCWFFFIISCFSFFSINTLNIQKP